MQKLSFKHFKRPPRPALAALGLAAALAGALAFMYYWRVVYYLDDRGVPALLLYGAAAVFVLSHIDRMPLGDISGVIHDLIVYHPDTDFCYTYEYDGKSFTLDTREFREILGDIPLNSPEVSSYISDYLTENKLETDGGASL